MKNSWKKKISNMPLSQKLRWAFAIVLVPLITMLGLCIAMIWNENRHYDEMVEASVKASEFSLDFKKEFDYETYLVIVESKTFEESSLMSMLEQANSVVDSLAGAGSVSKANRDRLTDIDKYLTNLETYVGRIAENLKQGEMYKDNIRIWENDVQIVTGLVRETILQFMYYEIQDMQAMNSQLRQFYGTLLLYAILASAIVLVFVFWATHAVTRSITRPILRLGEVTEQVAKGDFSVRTNLDTGAEIGELGRSLDSMIDQINILLGQIKAEQERIRRAELELLQSQINPHFLYNTLDTIVWLAEGGDRETVVSMVEQLSDFFRATLNEGKEVVTIREELKHVSSYLGIQRVRYQDILSYEVDIPEELFEDTIPKITLQPLVENALYHGIKNKRGMGKIRVTGEVKDGETWLYVEDDGIGITPERLEQIRQKISSDDPQESEIFGLNNVNERIRLCFGAAYGIRIESTYREGSRVSIRLPHKTGHPDTEK
ncbi:MAG: sensor histidine kinase [Lachnospiraceae bacterium]|nr:sensor histidine kinase [Lachnospiraceae bacterium]